MVNRLVCFGCSHTYGDELEQEALYGDELDKHFQKALKRKKIPRRLPNGQFEPTEIKHGDAALWKSYNMSVKGLDAINKACNSKSYAGYLSELLDVEYINFAKPGNSNTGMYAEFNLFRHELTPDDLVIVAYTGPQRTTQFTLDGKTHTRVNTLVPGMKKDYLDGLTEYLLLHSEYGDDMLATLLQTYGMLRHIESVCTGVGCKLIMIDILDRYVHPPIAHPNLVRIYETMKNFDIRNYLPVEYTNFNRWWATVKILQNDYKMLTHTKMGFDVYSDTLMQKETLTVFKTAYGHYNHNFHKRYVHDILLPALKEYHDISI